MHCAQKKRDERDRQKIMNELLGELVYKYGMLQCFHRAMMYRFRKMATKRLKSMREEHLWFGP